MLVITLHWVTNWSFYHGDLVQANMERKIEKLPVGDENQTTDTHAETDWVV